MGSSQGNWTGGLYPHPLPCPSSAASTSARLPPVADPGERVLRKGAAHGGGVCQLEVAKCDLKFGAGRGGRILRPPRAAPSLFSRQVGGRRGEEGRAQ